MQLMFLPFLAFLLLWLVLKHEKSGFLWIFIANVTDAKNRTAPGQGILRRIAQFCYRQLDGFLLLTEAMNEVVNLQERPYLIVEGIVDQQLADQPERLPKDDLLTVAQNTA